MDPSIELFDACKDNIRGNNSSGKRASLVHISYEVEATPSDVYVTLGLLFENTAPCRLENAVFSVRLPDGANVSLVECEVEKPGGMIQGAPETRLKGKYCVNTLTDGPFFRCEVGQVELERDVVIFLKYNFQPMVDGNVIHMSLPLPGMQPTENAIRQRTGITLESKYPVKILEVSSSSHKIRSRFIARKAHIALINPFGQGDLELAIAAIDASRYLPSINMNSSSRTAFANLKKARRGAIPPRRAVDIDYAPLDIFEDYCSSDDINWVRDCKSPLARYSVPYYTPSKSNSFTTSPLSFFLSDSDEDDDSVYELEAEVAETAEGGKIEQEEMQSDDSIGWFDFSTFPASKCSQDLDFEYETEGQWLSGTHPQLQSTSWLKAEGSGEDDENSQWDDEDSYVDLLDSWQDEGAALATVVIIITPSERPRIVDIPAPKRPRKHVDKDVCYPQHFDRRPLQILNCNRRSTSNTSPPTPPSSPEIKNMRRSAPVLEMIALREKPQCLRRKVVNREATFAEVVNFADPVEEWLFNTMQSQEVDITPPDTPLELTESYHKL